MLSLKDTILIFYSHYDYSKLDRYPLLLKSTFLDELHEEFDNTCKNKHNCGGRFYKMIIIDNYRELSMEITSKIIGDISYYSLIPLTQKNMNIIRNIGLYKFLKDN